MNKREKNTGRFVNQGKKIDCVCLICSSNFSIYGGSGSGKYCSMACYNKSRTKKIVKECIQCKKEFILRRGRKNKQLESTKYCSKKCQNDSQRTSKEVGCLYCGEKFIAFQSHLEQGRKYCSVECYGKHTTEQALVDKECVVCLKEFQTIKSNPASCCSSECGHKLSGQKKSGENHPMFGKKLSPEHIEKLIEANTGRSPWNKIGDGITPKEKLERAKFRKTVQKEVLKRDNYACQMCNKRGCYLHVDHIQPWAEYVELRFDINNCRTLCVDCHYLVTFGKEKPDNSTWGIINLETIKG